jgi:hypothetical protein
MAFDLPVAWPFLASLPSLSANTAARRWGIIACGDVAKIGTQAMTKWTCDPRIAPVIKHNTAEQMCRGRKGGDEL